MNPTSDNPGALTAQLYARSDKKLRAFCESRFEDLFELCGGHYAARPRVDEFPQVATHLNQLGARQTEFPWHGSVWALASECLFAILRDEWRAREVREFMERVESIGEIIHQQPGDDEA